MHSDAELDRRAASTLLASWKEYARRATDASVQHVRGGTFAVFPHEPERSVYNNAFLERHLSVVERAHALDAGITMGRAGIEPATLG